MVCCNGVKTVLAVLLQLTETGSPYTSPTSKPEGQALPSMGLSQHTWKHLHSSFQRAEANKHIRLCLRQRNTL